MKRCLIFTLLLVFLLTGCFEMHPPASTAPPRTDPPETTAVPTEEVEEPSEDVPETTEVVPTTWEHYRGSMATNPGLKEAELPILDTASEIHFRYENFDVVIMDPEDIDYIVGEIYQILQENSMDSAIAPWKYTLELLDAEGNQLALFEQIAPISLRYNGQSHVGNGSELFHFLTQYILGDFQLEDVSSVMLRSLRGGQEYIEISEREDVEFILSQLTPLLQKPSVEMNPYEGWTFAMELRDANGETIMHVGHITPDFVDFEGFLYRGDCSALYEYIINLTE